MLDLNEKRICEFCHLNEVQDETHQLFYCPQYMYTITRDTFIDNMKAILNTVLVDKDSFIEKYFAQIMSMHYFIYRTSLINIS